MLVVTPIFVYKKVLSLSFTHTHTHFLSLSLYVCACVCVVIISFCRLPSMLTWIGWFDKCQPVKSLHQTFVTVSAGFLPPFLTSLTRQSKLSAFYVTQAQARSVLAKVFTARCPSKCPPLCSVD